MSFLSPFGQAGQWSKGSPHTHTTQSDGTLPPAENMQWHAAHGYGEFADERRLSDELHLHINFAQMLRGLPNQYHRCRANLPSLPVC